MAIFKDYKLSHGGDKVILSTYQGDGEMEIYIENSHSSIFIPKGLVGLRTLIHMVEDDNG